MAILTCINCGFCTNEHGICEKCGENNWDCDEYDLDDTDLFGIDDYIDEILE